MGSAGYSFQLERVSGKATNGRVRTVVLNTLIQVWAGRRNAMLPWEWKRFASDWICMGEDSLLTIEVEDGQITFWFYESVGWSEGLAQHWLMLALALRRGEFEAALGRIGYRINPKDWPDLKNQYRNAKIRYFHGDNGIGEHSSEGIYWQVKDGNYEAPITPVEDLSLEARAEMQRVLDTDCCRCCVCKSLWPHKPEPEEVPGVTLESEAVFVAEDLGVLDIRPEGCIVAVGGRYDSNWAGRTDSVGDRWAGIVELSDPKRHLDAIIPTEDALVAHASTNSGLRYVSTSTDGGRTWSEQTVLAAFGKTKRTRLYHDTSTNDVYAAGDPAKSLFRSTDGGRSFNLVSSDFQLGGKPVVSILSIAGCGGRLFAIFRLKDYEQQLVASDDHGASFKTISLPRVTYPLGVFATKDALFCIVHEDGNVGVMRSTDKGATFTYHPIGKGSFSTIAAGPRGILVGLKEYHRTTGGGVFHSEDGRSFELVSNHRAAHVFADPTGQHLGFIFAKPVLFSLRRA